MDLAESGINKKAPIKGRVVEIFNRIRPHPILGKPLKEYVTPCTDIGNWKPIFHSAETIDCATAN
jgi:hypothetical protein